MANHSQCGPAVPNVTPLPPPPASTSADNAPTSCSGPPTSANASERYGANVKNVQIAVHPHQANVWPVNLWQALVWF